MNTDITIAIDGFSSCGKSTLARELAHRLAYVHVDSGAMYRAVTLHAIQHNIDIEDQDALTAALDEIDITFIRKDRSCSTVLNGTDVEQRIRSMDVTMLVSYVAAISTVRQKLVAHQRLLGAQKRVIMDGRDIGTVVFPDAELKLFLTADFDTRVTRRLEELLEKGMPVSRAEVATSLANRDRIDSTRADSPLVQAKDAVMIDNSTLSRSDQLDLAYHLALERISLLHS